MQLLASCARPSGPPIACDLLDDGRGGHPLRAIPRPEAAPGACVALGRGSRAGRRDRSPLEDLFLPICADYGIRMPIVNVPVLDYEVDCLWLPERLVVELDGWGSHKSQRAFEADRRRDTSIAARLRHHVYGRPTSV